MITSTDIRKTREDLGMTRDEFAQVMGVGYMAVQSWELGRRTPTKARRATIEALGRLGREKDREKLEQHATASREEGPAESREP